MVDCFQDCDLIIICPQCSNLFLVSLIKGGLHYEECQFCAYLPEQNEILTQVEEGLASSDTVQMIIIQALPANDQVICDICNTEIDETAEGGCFVGSYSVCPECTKKILADSSEAEKKEIILVEGPFKMAVLKKREEDAQM